jgi:hypothetical protein
LPIGFTETNYPHLKEYWFSTHFIVRWHEAKMLCKSYGLELVSFDSAEEMTNFTETENIFTTYVYIDGIKKMTGNTTFEWYWAGTGEQLKFSPRYDYREPNGGAGERCMCFIKRSNETFFHDVDCVNGIPAQFICQSREF